MRRPSFAELTLLAPVLMLITGVVIAFAQEGGGSYTVQPGDVLDLLAAEFNVDVQCLAGANQLGNPARIFPGQVLTIPGNCPPYQGQSTPRADADAEASADQGGGAAPAQPAPGDSAYTIQRGDTFDTIAQRLDISLQALLAANPGVDPTALLPGDVIIIPGDAPAYGEFLILGAGQGGGGGIPGAGPGERVYIVQPRDVLDLIAAALDADLQCLIERNELSDPPLIYPGQQIIIPANCPPYTGLSTALTLRAPVYGPNDVPAGTGSGESGGEVEAGSTEAAATTAPAATLVPPSPTAAGQSAATVIPPSPTIESFDAQFVTPTLRGDQGGGGATLDLTLAAGLTPPAGSVPTATATPDLTLTALANPTATATFAPTVTPTLPAPTATTAAPEVTEAPVEEETAAAPLATAQPAIIITDAP